MKMAFNSNFRKKKYCKFCERKLDAIDFKDTDTLRKYLSERGKILSRKITGTCSFHQRKLTVAVKRARVMALLPFVDQK